MQRIQIVLRDFDERKVMELKIIMTLAVWYLI